MPSSGGNPRLPGIDLLKVLLACLVVTIHANPLKHISPDAVWILGNGIARVAVPAFFVVAGFNFRPEIPGRSRHLFIRYIKLHAIWITLYTPFWWQEFVHNGLLQFIDYWVHGWWQLWFLTGLAVSVAATALVHRWRNGAILLLAALLLISGVLLQAGMMWDVIPRDFVFGSRNGVFLGLPFFLLGYLARRWDMPSRISFAAACGAALAGLVLMVTESMTLKAIAPHPIAPENFLSATIAAPALLLAAATSRNLPSILSRIPLSNLSAGIYFLHVAFVIALPQYFDLPRYGVYFSAISGSLAITFVLNRLHLTRYIF